MINYEIFKLPLGFLKCLQLVFTLIAFASVANFGHTIQYKAPADGCTPVVFSFGYPFDLTSIVFQSNSCVRSATAPAPMMKPIGDSYKSSAEFFVFMGVMTMLWAIAQMVIYLCFWHKYESENRYACADFITTTIFAVLWLFAAISWAFSAGGIGSLTSPASLAVALKKTDTACSSGTCKFTPDSWGYAGTSIGAVAGFACLFLTVGNVWFVWKETVWFRNRSVQPPVGSGEFHGPPVPDGPRVA